METLLQRISRSFIEKTNRHKSRNRNMRIYQRLHNLLKDAIINNDIPKDSILPSTRLLSQELGVSRSTVIKAYELLKLEGYIDANLGAGHKVRGISHDTSPLPSPAKNFEYPDISELGKSFQKNVTLINSTDDKSIAFRPGLPPLDIFPVNQWKNLSNLYWRHIKSSALSYSPSSGLDQLKINIANYLNLSRNIKCDPRQIIIVSGSVQSLYLVGNVLLNPGDSITMENPTFPNVYSIFKGLMANIKTVDVDNQGLKVSELSEDHAKSKLIHVTPSSHYPSGNVMSVERRLELLKWANQSGAFIIENDYEHEVHNYKAPIPSLFNLDQQQRTIYLSTFNRLLHPSIRVAYMVVPPFLLDAMEALLKHSHRFVPTSIQVVLNQFIEKNYLHNHIKHVNEVAEERKAIFTQSFYEHFGETAHLSPTNSSSLHLLAQFNKPVNDRLVVEKLGSQNIVSHSYSKCYISEPKQNGLILGFSSVRTPVIKRKVAHMAQAFKQLK